jgi:hypothetical protein
MTEQLSMIVVYMLMCPVLNHLFLLYSVSMDMENWIAATGVWMSRVCSLDDFITVLFELLFLSVW